MPCLLFFVSYTKESGDIVFENPGRNPLYMELYLKLRAVDFGLRTLYGHAEGFRVLGRTQMHCLPEAGR